MNQWERVARQPLDGAASRDSLLDRGLRAIVWRRLAHLRSGVLEIRDARGTGRFGTPSDEALSARIDVIDPRAYRAVALGGTIGAAEAYAEGTWTVDDLTALVRIMARNRSAADRLEGWTTWAQWAAHRLSFVRRRNREGQSRRNISAHYDLGNDFFAAFLDPTMTYSCAVFPGPDSTLEEASRHKLDLICRKLDLGPSDELLEIGTGWGSLALHAATQYGCRVVTTTISRRQYDHVHRAVETAGLQDRVRVVAADYRELPGLLRRRFDKVVSIEMIEAVGYDYLDRYFTVCDTMTKPGGAMLLQAIVIEDAFYEAYRRSVDVIQRYIFPGGFLPSVADLRRRVDRTSFRVADLDDITEHYPPTLRQWHEGVRRSWDQLRASGYSESLLRMWEYYLCYCEGGFRERTIGDVQMVLAKARS